MNSIDFDDVSADASRLLELVDAVVQLASKRISEKTVLWRNRNYQIILENFSNIAGSIERGEAWVEENIGGGAGFGATRAISDWGLGDEEMYAAAWEAEEFFRTGEVRRLSRGPD